MLMAYSLETLEFDALLEIVASNAQTPMGARLICKLRPFAGRPVLESALAAITEAIVINEESKVSWSFSGLADPSDAIALLRIKNTSLEPNSLLAIADLCSRALYTRSILYPEKENCPTLWQLIESVPPSMLAVTENIRSIILPGGELSDDASPDLKRLRREINLQRSRLTHTLEAAMRAAGAAIQDELVTIRNDRFVIPVKTDHRGKVSGVAHGFSSSGQTVYVEPLNAIEANNELQSLKSQEEQEAARIIFSLTESLRASLPEVEAAADAVARLDAVKAKVEFARRFNAVVPEITENTLNIIDARHPLLLNAGEVVPNTFGLTTTQPVMIISGANAGGKTVVLKTAGALSLMAVSGLPVTATHAQIPFYRSILADIGDHQSLSANLSTFSSHMSNIAGMIRDCMPPSLVLLDEAGTGTDPDEGSALGVAIVDHFRSAGAQVIASTHYRGLKVYAANDEGVINASVEFDERTLQPTYKLLIGQAGASSGLEIAKRFGIAQDVIDAARRNHDTAAQKLEHYLRLLQEETKIVRDTRLALEEEREVVAVKYASIENEAAQKEKTRQREFEAALASAVDDFDRQSKAFLQTIEDKALKNRLEKERRSRKAELNRAVLSKIGQTPIRQAGHERDAAAEPASSDAIKVGSRVITSFGNVGTVEKFDGKLAEILVGSIRLREKLSDLRFADTPPKSDVGELKMKRPANPAFSVDENRNAPIELNLIGKTTADAEYELDRFIDNAYLSHTPRVRIIHGFGTGALKNYVHHFLKQSDLIRSFEFAPQDQGGHGATIAVIDL